MLRGTCYFPSTFAALTYYAYENATKQDIQAKIDAGEIIIGMPTLGPREKLVLIDNRTRYGIEEK